MSSDVSKGPLLQNSLPLDFFNCDFLHPAIHLLRYLYVPIVNLSEWHFQFLWNDHFKIQIAQVTLCQGLRRSSQAAEVVKVKGDSVNPCLLPCIWGNMEYLNHTHACTLSETHIGCAPVQFAWNDLVCVIYTGLPPVTGWMCMFNFFLFSIGFIISCQHFSCVY